MDFGKVFDYINEHLQEDISLISLGKLTGYSPWHVYKLFKFYTGEPLMSYIRKQRLKAAAKDIEANKKLLDIALDYGYETAAGFYKAFVKQFGCPPSEYKNSVCHYHKKYTSVDITEIIYENGVITMGTVTVRQLQQEDAISLHENIYIANTLSEVEARVAQSLENIGKGNQIQMVAIVDHNIVGTLILCKETHSLYQHCGCLYDEVVNPAFNGMGIPNLLFDEIKKFAQKIGVKIIKGSSRADYFTQLFYQENHFIELGRIPGGLIEPWNDNKAYDEVLYYLVI